MTTMLWWQNLPLFMIIGALIGAAVCSVLKAKAARAVVTVLSALECAGMGILLYFTLTRNASFVFAMGEIGAPFGNELRVSAAEALVGLLFALVMFLAVLGGWKQFTADIAPNRVNLYAAVFCLLTAAMTAMTFTNDLFTAYVFIEISTIAACALILSRNQGRTMLAAARYMIMNLLGSGLFLLGLSILYVLSGHLLFPQLGEAVRRLAAENRYSMPMYISFLLMTLGIAIKSALYPFHTWLPGAYSTATATSSAVLSSVVSKMYIFLLVKIFFRAAGTDVFARRIEDVLFIYAMVGVIMGSVHAILQHHMMRMIAYSSVAQIGYIFLGISLGTKAGFAAALFHILAHSSAKSMLFLAGNKLRAAAGDHDTFPALRGAAKKAPLAALAFLVGALSLVGVPVLGGFASKVYLAKAAVELGGWRMVLLLADLLVSTALNVGYMLRTVLTLYRPAEEAEAEPAEKTKDAPFAFAMGVLIVINLGLGVFASPVMNWIQQGIAMFV